MRRDLAGGDRAQAARELEASSVGDAQRGATLPHGSKKSARRREGPAGQVDATPRQRRYARVLA